MWPQWIFSITREKRYILVNFILLIYRGIEKIGSLPPNLPFPNAVLKKWTKISSNISFAISFALIWSLKSLNTLDNCTLHIQKKIWITVSLLYLNSSFRTTRNSTTQIITQISLPSLLQNKRKKKLEIAPRPRLTSYPGKGVRMVQLTRKSESEVTWPRTTKPASTLSFHLTRASVWKNKERDKELYGFDLMLVRIFFLFLIYLFFPFLSFLILILYLSLSVFLFLSPYLNMLPLTLIFSPSHQYASPHLNILPLCLLCFPPPKYTSPHLNKFPLTLICFPYLNTFPLTSINSPSP